MRFRWEIQISAVHVVKCCLSSYVPAVEELARKDDLTLLFLAVTSTCPQHNIAWRKTASDVLLTVSRQVCDQK